MGRRAVHPGRRMLARNLRGLRIAHGMSQEELGYASGLRQAHISEIETAKSNVTLDALERLAVALGVRLADLLDDAKR